MLEEKRASLVLSFVVGGRFEVGKSSVGHKIKRPRFFPAEICENKKIFFSVSIWPKMHYLFLKREN